MRRYREESGILHPENGKPLSCREIFELSYQNSPVAVKVVKENAELVGIGLANLISIFAPEIIVVGGGMSEANDNYLAMIRQSAFANSLENCRSEVKIERGPSGIQRIIVGQRVLGDDQTRGEKYLGIGRLLLPLRGIAMTLQVI